MFFVKYFYSVLLLLSLPSLHVEALIEGDPIPYNPKIFNLSLIPDGLCNKSIGYYNGTVIKTIPAKNSIEILTSPFYNETSKKIGEILKPSLDYEISFDIIPHEILNEDSTILRFTIDSSSDKAKYGDRSPLFQFSRNELKISSSQSTTYDPNPEEISSIELELDKEYRIKFEANWRHVLYVDGQKDTTYVSWNTDRIQHEAVEIFYGDNFYPPSKATVKNLYFTPLPKQEWTWSDCAHQCAVNDDCEYWVLEVVENVCKLMKDPQEFYYMFGYFSARKDPDCLYFYPVPTMAPTTFAPDGICHQESANGAYNGTLERFIPARNSISLISTRMATESFSKIGELHLPSRAYEITFDLTPVHIVSEHSTILLFTADPESEVDKYGDSSPIFKFWKNSFRLFFSQSTTLNNNPYVVSDIGLEGLQTYRVKLTADARTVTLHINGELVEEQLSAIDTRPQLGKLEVYIGDHFHSTSKAFINNLYFTPLPKMTWTWESCAKECASDNKCSFWTLDGTEDVCNLLSHGAAFQVDETSISGISDLDCIVFESVICNENLEAYHIITEKSLPGVESISLISFNTFHIIEKNFKLETEILKPALSYEIEFNIIPTGIVTTGWLTYYQGSILRFTNDPSYDAKSYGNRAPIITFAPDSLRLNICQSTLGDTKNCVNVDEECTLKLNHNHHVKLIQQLEKMLLLVDKRECLNLDFERQDRTELDKLEVFASDDHYVFPAKAILNNLIFTPIYEEQLYEKIQWSEESCNEACADDELCDFWVLDSENDSHCKFMSVKRDETLQHNRLLQSETPSSFGNKGSMFVGEAKFDEFGRAVSISKNGLVLGVSGWKNDGAQENAGHVIIYEFVRNKNQWYPLGNEIFGREQFAQSGYSMAFSNDGYTIAIGSPEFEEGHVSVYRFYPQDNEWKKLGLDISGEKLGDKFGFAVAMSSDGNTIICGAPRYDNGRGLAKVYTYNYEDNTWRPIGNGLKCGADGKRDCDEAYESGTSVEISGDGMRVAIAAIGSYQEENKRIPGSVTIYDYDLNDESWEQMGSSIWGDICLDLLHWTLFGSSLSMTEDGSLLAIGAPRQKNENQAGQVQVYSFNEIGKSWSQVGPTILGRNKTDGFGSSIALADNGVNIAIGTSATYSSGYVSLFELNQNLDWIEVANSISNSPFDQDDSHINGVAISADGQNVVVGGYQVQDDKKGYTQVFESPTCERDSCDVKLRCSMHNCVKKTLAIRVISADSSTTNSSAELSDALFGTNGKSFTMRSQLEECSFGFFKIQPFTGSSTHGVNIVNGVGEVLLSDNVVGKDTVLVRRLVEEEATAKYGDLSQFGFVMLCLPPGTILGTPNWVAYAFQNSYLSVYNDLYCTYPSVHMHEIGHNLGLTHSNHEVDYGDNQGYLGSIFEETNGPKMCFNGPKSWELGWYDGSYVTLSAYGLEKNNGFNTVKLIGFVDYDKLSSNFFTVCRIIGSDDGYQYFLNFNRKSGFNVGTREGGDKVMLTKKREADSTLVAKLNSGDKYYFYEYSATKLLKLEIAHIFLDEDLPYAEVKLVYGQTCESEKDCDNSNSCTYDVCNNLNQCVHQELLCSYCGSKVNFQVHNTNIPKDITWNFYHIEKSQNVFSDSVYFKSNANEYRERCLEIGSYKFLIVGQGNVQELHNFEYKISIGSRLLYDKAPSYQDEINFTICKEDLDCNDFDGCTIDTCDKNDNLCIFERVNKCLNCNNVTIKIRTDNYASETSWEIANEIGDSIMSSNSYRGLDFGRSKMNSRKKHASLPSDRKMLTRGYWRALMNEVSAYPEPFLTGRNSLTVSRRNNAIANSFSYTKCLGYNSRYSFRIFDSFGDGMCCAEGSGFYNIMVADQLLHSGGNFTFFENFFFKLTQCTTNHDCINDDACFESECKSELSVCIFTPLSCSSCGEVVSINIFTDDFPYETSWTIERTDDNKKVVMISDPYKQSRRSYLQSSCLQGGGYQFTINDKGADGLCYNGECGFFELMINGELIESGGQHFEEQFTVHFEVLVPPSPTLAPTFSNITKFPISHIGEQWNINFDTVLLDKKKSNDLDSLIIQYQVSKGKKEEQLMSQLFRQNCTEKSNDTFIFISKKEIERNSTANTFDKATIFVEYNRSSLMKSNQWNRLSNTTGEYLFCLKTEMLLDDNSELSVSFIETDVKLKFDFEANFASFEIDEIQVNKFKTQGVEKEHEFVVGACICNTDGKDYQCMDDTVLSQNTNFKLCILPFDSLKVKQVDEMIFYQDELAKSMPVKHGAPNKLTSTRITENIAIVETILVSSFFEETSPPPVTVVGSVALEFDSRRTLGEIESQLMEHKKADFNVKINLRTSSSKKLIKTLVFICALIVIAGLVAKIKLERDFESKYYDLVNMEDEGF